MSVCGSTEVISSTELLESAQQFAAFVDSRKDEYSFEELLLDLGVPRERKVPRTTLIKWLQELQFPVQKEGYTEFHRKKLAALALYLRTEEKRRKRGTFSKFKIAWNEYQKYLRKQREVQNEPRESNRTVECECVRL